MAGASGANGGASGSAALSSSLRVTVEPGQSSFFAGEYFHCRITFANVAPPAAGQQQQQLHLQSGKDPRARALAEEDAAVPGTPTTPRSRLLNSSSGSADGASSPTTASASASGPGSPARSGTSTPNSSARRPAHTRKASSSLIAPPPPPASRSHAKSQSLYDVRQAGAPPDKAGKKAAGGSAIAASGGGARLQRRGLLGRGFLKARAAHAAAAAEAAADTSAGSASGTTARKVSHGKAASVAVAHFSQAKGSASGDASVHGLGLGLPGRRGSGGGFPASRNASVVLGAGASEDMNRTVSSSSSSSSLGAMRGAARPGPLSAASVGALSLQEENAEEADDSTEAAAGGAGSSSGTSSKRPKQLLTSAGARAKSLVHASAASPRRLLAPSSASGAGAHPHARKKSIVQTQAVDLTEAFALEMGLDAADRTPEGEEPPSAGTSGSAPSSGRTDEHGADSSSASAGEDSFASAGSKGAGSAGGGNGFYGIGRNDTMDSVVREDLTERLGPGRRAGPAALPLDRRVSTSSMRSMLSPTNHSSSLTSFPLARTASGSGSGPPTPTALDTSGSGAAALPPGASPLFPLPAHAHVAPGAEVLLWSYAQFSGTFSIDESLIKPFDFELVKHRIAQGTIAASTDGPAAAAALTPGGRSELQMQQRQGPARTVGGGQLISLGQEDVVPELRMGGEDEGGAALPVGGGSGAGGPEESAEAMRRAISGEGMGKSAESDGWTAYLRNRLTLGGGGGSGQSAAGADVSTSANGRTSPVGGEPAPSGPTGGRLGLLRRSNKHKRTGSTLVDTSQKTLLAKGIPTFSTPPSILCVDLALEPGQRKTYDFRLPLPPDLPPSYLGKAISFTYTLAIGTNRMDLSDAAARSGARKPAQKSRLIQIPIRVYNHVAVSGARPFWDLLNPHVWVRDGAVVTTLEGDAEGEEADAALEAPTPEPAAHATSAASAQELAKLQKKRDESSHANLVSYAKELLASCAVGPNGMSPAAMSGSALEIGAESPPTARAAGARSPGKGLLRRRSSAMSATSRGGAEEDTIDTCMEAVEVLSRTSPKVSYDIAKDGQIAAVLTLIKSKMRLGDSVAGVITINPKTAYARIVRVAVHLESHEDIQSDVATLPSARTQKLTKRIVASHHDSTLDAGQVSFSLPIPSGATPEFTTSGVKLQWSLRLSLLTLTSTKPPAPKQAAASADGAIAKSAATATKRMLPPPHLMPGTPDGFALYHQSLCAPPSLCGPLPSFTPDESHRDFLARHGYGTEAKLEIVECSVPITVLPNSTRFKTASVRFAA